jgi:hypothetical protein
MSLLARALGYVRLTEPVRFRNQWEQHASLRLRDGDLTVLAGYDQHGRITGGDPEEMMDAAAAAYVALAAGGADVLLMAAEHALRRELCRRIRDDLIGLGIVADGPAVRIAGGAQAGPGDLIVCTRNDHHVEAGEPGRTLANGDLLLIEAVTGAGPVVRRALDAGPQTGQWRWTGRTFSYQDFRGAELGYAVTDHVAQGRTVHTGLAVITGAEDRQHAYVAMSRGTDANYAYVFTISPKRADLVPGPRPAPELARYDQIHAERDGVRAPAPRPASLGTALGVLASVLDRDGQQASATQTRQQALADADHLAVLHAIWTAETAPARQQRYRAQLAAALPPEHRPEPGHQARWLWRTLRGAELAGLDPAHRPPVRPLRYRRSQSRRQPRSARHRQPATGTRRQLPRPARGLAATGDHLRHRHGRPGRLGCRHPRSALPGRGRRRRTAPPPPWPALPAAVLGRTPARHAGPARRAHPHRRAADPGTGPVDQRSGRRAPRVRGHARRTAEPDRPVRGSRLRGPGPGVPAVARAGHGRHLAAAQTRDPPVPAGPSPCAWSRRRPGGRRLTVPRAILGTGR